jgi:hypothetical protein
MTGAGAAGIGLLNRGRSMASGRLAAGDGVVSARQLVDWAVPKRVSRPVRTPPHHPGTGTFDYP